MLSTDCSYLFYSARFDAEGGRRVADLPDLVEFASNFSHVFVIVGDNNVKFDSVEYIYRHYINFADALWPSTVRFSGHFKRGDLNPIKVENNNLFLHEKLGRLYKSPRLIKWKGFQTGSQNYHFRPDGEGFRHMCAYVLSALEEFDKFW